MAKQNKAKVSRKGPARRTKVSRAPASRKSMSNPSNPTFGAVSTINTAPVAIGNSMRGAQAQVISRAGDGVRVVGRDFAFQPAATGTVSGWVNVGGFPLTPAAFVSSVLRSYCQIYNKFKFNKLNIHYITSSATSSTGDVMFQINKNRDDPCANNTATTFLSYALSDPSTVIGPQWTNHTATIVPKGPFRTLDLGVNSDINAQTQGEVFLYSKTTTTDSPGWVIMDYDITFAEMSINPRAGLLPNSLILYQPCQLLATAGAYVLNTNQIPFTGGTRWVGNTTITNPFATGNYGDVFKITLDVTNTVASNWTKTVGTQPTTANLIVENLAALVDINVTLTDGITLYAVIINVNQIILYPNIAIAFAAATNDIGFQPGFTGTLPAYGEAAGVPNAGVWLYALASYVGTVNPNILKQQ